MQSLLPVSMQNKNTHRGSHALIISFALIIFSLLATNSLSAQTGGTESLFQVRMSINYPLQELPVNSNVIEGDTIIPVERRLLPENMSFMEKFLWDENGFVRKIDIASPLTPEVRKNELAVRRTMLTAHQIGGFTAMALMIATLYYGQKTIDGRRDLGDTHSGLAAATIISYSLTAGLSILSPPPYIRRGETSTTTIHKTLAWVHAAGMILTPILGSMVGEGRVIDMDKAHFHQISAYITSIVFAAAMAVMTF